MKSIEEKAMEYANDPISITNSLFTAFMEGANEMRKRVIEAFCLTCESNKNGECHSFIVGYDTPDDRLYEKCIDNRGTNLCNMRIVDFLYTLNNLEEYKQK